MALTACLPGAALPAGAAKFAKRMVSSMASFLPRKGNACLIVTPGKSLRSQYLRKMTLPDLVT